MRLPLFFGIFEVGGWKENAEFLYRDVVTIAKDSFTPPFRFCSELERKLMGTEVTRNKVYLNGEWLMCTQNLSVFKPIDNQV